MKCYLAHPITDYGGTERQKRAIAAIEAQGWTVENPDQPIHQAAYREHGMAHFVEVVKSCSALAFVRFPGGMIGAGVAREIEAALTAGLRVYDVTVGTLEYSGTMMPYPVLSVEQTRELIAALRGVIPDVAQPAVKSGILALEVGDWTLSVRDYAGGFEVNIREGGKCAATHYIRLDPEQSETLRDFLVEMSAAQPPAAPVHQEDACAAAAKEYNAEHFPSSAASEHAKVADWLDDQARIATNSLHCGDNSAMIQQTHDWANRLEAAARHLRAVSAETSGQEG